MKFSVNSTVELQIEKLVVGGEGLARKDGAVFFVPLTAPGDLVKARITEDKKNFFRAEVVELLQASPQRTRPECSYFGECGGCSWQHLKYEAQLEAKKNLVLENLQKFLKTDSLPFQGIVPSPQQWRYRNRIQPQIQEGRLGFQGAKSHKLVPIEDCLIAEKTLLSLWPDIKKKNSKTASARIELYLSQDGHPHWYSMEEEKGDLGFSQVNEAVNQLLIQTLIDWGQSFSGQRIIDLYAGAGNLTFPFSNAHKKKQVVGVELHPVLVQKAREISQKISPKSLEFYNADVGLFLKRFRLGSDDLVILDPPRAGADEFVIKSIAEARVQKIFYVSCHPVSLARDLERLLRWGKKASREYKISRIQCFDMFPQTDHVETLVEIS